MSAKKLHIAVDCCTRDGSWESTCGKCPFRNRETNKSAIEVACDISCINNLILALAEYLPKEEED